MSTDEPTAPVVPDRRSWLPWALLGGSAVAVVLVVVGALFIFDRVTSEPTEANIPGIEREIREGVKDQAGVRATVECPSSVTWKSGGEFHCVVEGSGGQRAMATVHMENDDGDITWRLD